MGSWSWRPSTSLKAAAVGQTVGPVSCFIHHILNGSLKVCDVCLQGVVGGVTGIVTKPVEGRSFRRCHSHSAFLLNSFSNLVIPGKWLWLRAGAKKEGAAGFFKGIGKGLVGVVARPTGGIVDMASSTFQGIQR